MNSFGDNLERLMKARGISGRALAKKLGVPSKTFNEWVGSGGRMPRSPEILKQMAALFNVSVHELLFAEPDPNGLIGGLLEKTEIHNGLYEITVRKVKTKDK